MKKIRALSLSICIILISISAILPAAAELPEVYPGGMAVGLKFATDGVGIVGFCSVNGKTPASDAGLKPGDVILEADGLKIQSAQELADKVNNSNGKELYFTVLRGDRRQSFAVTPIYSEDESRWKTGIIVRDTGAGIGTVTFILPYSNGFAGLGHGICNSETGELVKISNGDVVGVQIYGIEKGCNGNPGELKGCFTEGKIGAMIANTQFGISGVFTNPPSGCCEKMQICPKSEVKNGDAYLLCALNGGSIEKYTVKIQDVNNSESGSKCFTVRITDPSLIAKTGGIVQGMSGSPIIQNGRLVGAVTHVLISDSTLGYGIFAENMLNAMPEIA